MGLAAPLSRASFFFLQPEHGKGGVLTEATAVWLCTQEQKEEKEQAEKDEEEKEEQGKPPVNARQLLQACEGVGRVERGWRLEDARRQHHQRQNMAYQPRAGEQKLYVPSVRGVRDGCM